MILDDFRDRLAQFTNNPADQQALLNLVEEIVVARTTDLQQERNQAQRYLQIAASALVSLDTEGKVVLVNERACELLEYTSDELVGQSWFDLCVPEEERETVRATFIQIVAGDVEPVVYYENQVLTKNGRLKLIAWHNSYHTDPATGKISGTFSAGNDITRRRAMEEALKQNELRYRQMFYNNNAVKLVIDPEHGDIIDANAAACGFYGYPQHEITQMNIADLNVPGVDDSKAVSENRIDETQHYLYQHRLASGDIRDVEVYTSPMNIDDKVYQYSIVIDVTAREKARRALQLNELQFRTVVSQFPDGMMLMFDTDLYCTIARGQLMFDEIKHFDELEGQYLPDVLPSRIWQHVQGDYEAALNGKSSRRSFQNNDKYFLVQIEPLYDDDQVLIGGLHIFQDITGIRQSQRLLRETREQLDTILNGIADGVAVISTDLEILYANETAAHILGYGSVADLIKGAEDELFINHDPLDENGKFLEFEEQALYKALQGESPPPQRIVFKNPETGKEYWTDTKATPIFDNDGNLRFAVIILNDITRAHQMEQLRLEALHEKAQVETLREYIANTTHDLSQPLSVINTAVYMIDRTIEDERIQRHTAKIMAQSVRMHSILQDIRQISLLDSISKLQFMDIDLGQLIQQIADYSKERVTENGQEFRYEFTPGIKQVIGNPQYIERAVTQVLQNAMDYSPEGSIITMRCIDDTANVIIEIEDNGVGMEAEHLNQIFDRFYRIDKSRTTRPRSGTGLGLSISRRIMELHGGEIKVESEPGKGSLFRLTFPLQSPE